MDLSLVDASLRRDLAGQLRASGSVFAEREVDALARAAADEPGLRDLVARRADGEPIEYLVGHADFAGLRLRVAPGVFVPRQRTEFLARLAAGLLPAGGRLLDLGCGVGTIAAYVARSDASAAIVAVDLDPAALICARANLPPDAVVTAASEPDDLPAGPFDVIAANLPYVPSGRLAFMPRDARDHEATRALDGGDDGLAPLRRYAPGLAQRLADGGRFLVEVAAAQAATASEVLRAAGLGRPVVHHDDALDATVVEASG